MIVPASDQGMAAIVREAQASPAGAKKSAALYATSALARPMLGAESWNWTPLKSSAAAVGRSGSEPDPNTACGVAQAVLGSGS